MATDFSSLIDPSYSSLVSVKPSATNPTVAEYDNAQSGMAFTPQDLVNFLQVHLQRNDINTSNVFDILKQSQTGGSTLSPTTADPQQALAEQAAKAGLSLDEYLKLNSTQNQGTAPDRTAIQSGLGIPSLEQLVFAMPSKTTEQLYNDAYGAAGLTDLKAKISALDKQIADIKSKYTAKGGDINENPFLSEASRVGRLGKLNEQQQLEIGNLIDAQKQYVDLYNQGINEVNGLVSRQAQDFSTGREFNQSRLQYLLQKAEQMYSDQSNKGTTTTDLSYLPAYLTARASQTTSEAPKLIGGASTGYFQWNPDTKTFEQAIAPAKTTSGSSSGGSTTKTQLAIQAENQIYDFLSQNAGTDRYVSPETWKQARQAWIADGYSGSTFDSKFKEYINPADPQDYR